MAISRDTRFWLVLFSVVVVCFAGLSEAGAQKKRKKKPAVQAKTGTTAGDGLVSVPKLRFPTGADNIGTSDIVRLHLQWARKNYNQQKILSRLYNRKLNYGYRNYFDFSAALTRQGDKARKQGEVDAAAMLYTYAAKFSPDLAEPHFRLFSLMLFSSPTKAPGYLPSLIRGFRLQVMEFFNVLSLASNTGLFLLLVLLVMLALAWPVVIFSALPALYRELEERLPDGTTSFQILFLMVLLFSLPFLARWGLLETVAYCTIWLWAFLKWKYRFVGLAVLGLLFASPELLSMGQKVTSISSKDIQNLYRLSRDAHPTALAEKIKKDLPRLEKTNKVLTFEYLWALGLYHKRRGELIWARRYYTKALSWQKHPALLINLGNVDAATGDTAKARDAYKLAMRRNPDIEQSRYNLLRITQGERIQKRFRNFDIETEFRSPEISVFLRASQTQLNRYLMDVEPSDARFWELHSAWLLNFKGADIHWAGVTRILPYNFRIPVGAGLFVFLLMLGILSKRLFPDRKPTLLMLDTQELSVDERTARSLAMDFYRRMKFRVQFGLSFVIMGADSLLDGKFLAGFFRIGLMSFVLVLWLTQPMVFPHPYGLGDAPGAGRWLLLGSSVVLGFLYLSNLRRVWASYRVKG